MNRIEAIAIARSSIVRLPLADRFWSKVDRRSDGECWPWLAAPRKKTEGYGAFWFEGRHQPANKMAWELTHGKVPDGMQVCHNCDNPPCCNPSHLFLGSNQQNNEDKVRKNRHCFGSRNGYSRLTEEDVLDIRKHKIPGIRVRNGTRTGLAEKHGVSPATITDVWSRSWKHI